MRVFFALVPPPPLQSTLGVVARDVARRAGGRPVPAENIHLTLAFIGAWPASSLARLLDIGERLEGRAVDFALDVLGGFRRAGVAWIGTSTMPPELSALAVSLGAALVQVGVTPDERPLHPHLTLARKCRGPYPGERVAPLRWTADAVTLMRSDTRAAGARYERIASWPLKPAPSRSAAGGR